MTIPELVIDLREEHELLDKLVVPMPNTEIMYEIVNIPSRHIFANVEWIAKQTEKRPVWLLCASGRRSQEIKDKYFATNDGIKSSNGGLSFGFGKSVGDSVNGDYITTVKGRGGFGIQQIMQLAFACMLSVIVILVFFNVRRDVVLAVGGLMIAAVLGQVFTRSCLLGKVVPKSVFVPK